MSAPMPLEDTEWMDDALVALATLAASQTVVTAEDLARVMRKPPHPNHVGLVFGLAKNLHYLVPTGYRPSMSKSRRGGVIRTWTRYPNDQRNVA